MASPTASPTTPGEEEDSPSVDAYICITINAGAKFDNFRGAGYARVWLGDPIVAALILHDIESTDRLINELCEGLAYMRHESANAKRCEARGSGEGA